MAIKLNTANLQYVFVQDYLGKSECVVASFLCPTDAFRFMQGENKHGANGRLFYNGELIPESVVDVTTLHEWRR